MIGQIKMIIFVVIMGIISAAILVGSDNFTKDIIHENEDLALKSSILDAFGIAYTEETVVDVYNESIRSEDKGETIIYYSEDGNVGYKFNGDGLWGPIRGFITLGPDRVSINGIQILYQEETPGLGGVVSEQGYLSKFKGKKLEPAIIVKKDADPSSEFEVDVITGATATSKAFELMLNESYQTRKGDLD